MPVREKMKAATFREPLTRPQRFGGAGLGPSRGAARRIVNEIYESCVWSSLERGAALSVGLLSPTQHVDRRTLLDVLRPSDHLLELDDRRLFALFPCTDSSGAWRAIARLERACAGLHVLGLVEVDPCWDLPRALAEAARHCEPPPEERRSRRLVAEVEWGELCDLIAWLASLGRRGRLAVRAPCLRGYLHLEAGKIVDAETESGDSGRCAALALLDVPEATVELIRDQAHPTRRLDSGATELLLEVARLRDERTRT